MKKYPVPWRLLAGLAPHVRHSTREQLEDFTAAVVAGMQPAPRVEGLDRLPEVPRFLLAANHYQRKGLWILFPAAVITQAIRQRYGPGNPPVRWVVTANWPPLELAGRKIASPGDWLLPRVAHALWCYEVPFAASNPVRAAKSLRRMVRDAPALARPIGLFPEGVAGTAGGPGEALAGIDRLIWHLARSGMPVAPAGVREEEGLVVRFGRAISCGELMHQEDAAKLVMERIAGLVRQSS